MFQFLKNLAKKNIENFFDIYSCPSYSHEGEDMLLRKIFENRQQGTYVDIGAHHPKRFSNTYYFYKQGWRGINIDPMPGSMKRFQRHRPLDINLEIAISSEAGEKIYYIYNEPALNTFDENLYKDIVEKGIYKLVGTKSVPVQRLDCILDQHLKGKKIQFMSIDTEGHEIEVLKSNNWDLYRPEYLLVEILFTNIQKINQSKIHVFLEQQKYQIFAKCYHTYIYQDTKDT